MTTIIREETEAKKNEFKERFNSSLKSITFIVLKTLFIM